MYRVNPCNPCLKYLLLDFTNQINAWLQCFSTLFPLSWAHFARVISHEDSSFYLANQFVCITTAAVVLDFCNLDLALRIHEESTAISHTIFFNHHTKATRENTCRVGQHRIVDLADAFRSIVPCLVYEVRVGTY